MKVPSNQILLKRLFDWAIAILVSTGAFYITLGSILIDVLLIIIHKTKAAGEIGLIGDLIFFTAVILARWYVRQNAKQK